MPLGLCWVESRHATEHPYNEQDSTPPPHKENRIVGSQMATVLRLRNPVLDLLEQLQLVLPGNTLSFLKYNVSYKEEQLTIINTETI